MTTAATTFRFPRLESLSSTTATYVAKELAKIDKDYAALKSILKGRTGSESLQTPTVAKVAEVAYTDLASYLKGE